jgi:glycosyltransferase involved in cell wall biosynthesis
MTKGDAKTCELPLKGRFHRVRRKALGLIDKFIAISSDINQALLSNGIPKEKIVQVPNGVDIHLFHPTDSCAKQEPSLTGPIDDGVVLLYVGSIDRRKNVNLLIDCFRKFLTMLDTERRKYKFVIAGPILDLAYYNEIQEYIQKHSLSSCVCFVGLVEQKEIVSLYSRATLFVFAGSNEGLPNAVIEAKAAGLPVVAFDTYGVRDVIRDGVDGHLVLFGETKQFAEKIKSVLLDQARLKRMSLLALNDVQQRYAFESIVDRYLDDVYISGSISFFPLLYRGNPSRR